MSSPAYRMPAEWERQDAVWLAWPHLKTDWPGKFEAIPHVFCEIIRHIARTQQVRLLVRDKQKSAVRELLEKASVNLECVSLHTAATNRGWMRDSGAIFVRDKDDKPHMLDWKFTGWAKYNNHRLDNRLPREMHIIRSHIPLVTPTHKGKRVVMEGGAIDVNGQGSILVTEECLLSDVQCRNPGFTRHDYEAIFAKYLGATNTIWLNKGIIGDDTHGHIDDITRFVSPYTVVTAVEPNTKDENHPILAENLKRLKRAQLQDGTPLTVVELPMPAPLYHDGQRLPASYANFLICNEVVLAPTFNDPNDRIALGILADLFPTREIIGIHAVDLVWGLGTLHCLSQQEICS